MRLSHCAFLLGLPAEGREACGGPGAACPWRGTEAPLPLPLPSGLLQPLPLLWPSRSLPPHLPPHTHRGCRLKTAGNKNSCADEAEWGPEHMKGLGLGWQRWRDLGIPQPHEHLPVELWGCPGLFLPLQSWGPPGCPRGPTAPRVLGASSAPGSRGRGYCGQSPGPSRAVCPR